MTRHGAAAGTRSVAAASCLLLALAASGCAPAAYDLTADVSYDPAIG